MYQIYDAIRKERGLKKCEVYKQTGIAPSTFSRWKRGDIKLKYETLSKIAQVLQVPVSVFYEGVTNDGSS